jgi:hypothetical protein
LKSSRAAARPAVRNRVLFPGRGRGAPELELPLDRLRRERMSRHPRARAANVADDLRGPIVIDCTDSRRRLRADHFDAHEERIRELCDETGDGHRRLVEHP